MYAVLDMRADGSEKVKYDYDGYYSYIRKSPLSVWPNYTANSHWHDELEFISVLSGYMDYNVNGEIIRINEGQGIVVNTRQLHFGFSSEQKECEFICILLHPMLLCTSQYIDREFVSPFLADSSVPYVFLDRREEWQRGILEALDEMCNCRDRKNAPLIIQSLFYRIWILLTENSLKEKRTKRKDRKLSVLKDMLLFIQKNYSEKVSLEDIARAGNVSKSTCLAVFKSFLKDTPSSYLIGYRLKASLKLLRESDLSVSEIAFEVGFQGASYFAEAFRKNYGCSPSEYRKARTMIQIRNEVQYGNNG